MLWAVPLAVFAAGRDDEHHVEPADLTVAFVGLSPDDTAVALRAFCSLADTRSLLREIEEGAERLSAIVGALKSYSYLDQAEVQEVEVRKGLDDTLLILKHKLSGIEVRRDYQAEPHRIQAYAGELNQVWTNLIDNAADALLESDIADPLIVLRVFTSGDGITVEVEDNGPGVPPDAIDRIFDAFFTTKPPGSGTGLGLSIVWNTVQEHNGWVEMKDNRPGVRFEIYLPGTRDEVYSQQDVGTARSLQGSGESILLIDDEQEQNELIAKLLTNLGYKVFSVVSGDDGLSFLQSQKVDLVILDMIMGNGLNGRETYERILKRYPHQKAIVMSGYSKNEETEKIKHLGVDHFLEKPVTLPQMGRAIKQILSKS